MKLSVVIPVYNEAKTILAVLQMLRQVPVEKEVIVVDDGSSDGTRELIESLQGNGIRAFFHDSNRGKGAALRTGFQHATGDLVVVQDGDLEYDPNDFPKLIAPIVNGEANVVYGSRILNPENAMSYFSYYWGGRLVTWVTNLLYGSRITDEPTCYKVFRRDLLLDLRLTCEGFDFCPEVTAKVLKRGERIVEVPISYRPRKIGEGKKIRWTDGLAAVWVLIRERFRS